MQKNQILKIMEKYNFEQIEEKWQDEWESKQLFEVNPK